MSVGIQRVTDEKIISEFRETLDKSGVHGALGFLNRRTPHRFTGIYRFDNKMLRNLYLYDSFNPRETSGEDAPMAKTYCSLVKEERKLEIRNAATDRRVMGKIDTPVMSYCGTLIKDDSGDPFGTLCHFDMKRCQEPSTEFGLMAEAAKLLAPLLQESRQAKPG